MARFSPDGLTKVAWATVANKAFPAQSELIAGDDIECFLTKDGLNITFNENEVNDATLCETFDATVPGSFGVSIELTMRRETPATDDDAWTTIFNVRGETGALVVRRGIDADTNWTAGQKVEVYPGTLGVRRPAATTSNEPEKFMINVYGSSEPSLDATVVAS